ncbi:MAG: KH domain-containing protein [Clostridia bacterium]|nr:KH domain-containing protein [Clostridia bacterium]
MEAEQKTISTEQVAELVEYIAKSLVDEPDAVKVTVKNTEEEDRPVEAAEDTEADDSEGQVTIELSVAKDDMGKVIGKQGRIAKAIRTVVRAATVKSEIKYRIDIL